MHSFDERVLVVFVLISAMVTLYRIVAVGFSGRKAGASLRARAELQTKVLDRLGSGREVIEFSQTEGGKQFIEALSMENVEGAPSKASPTEKILAAVQKGLILTLLGVGFLFLAWQFHREDAGDFFTVVGVVGVSLGVGFLLSAGVSYRLSRSMGLLAASDIARSKGMFSQS